VESQGEDGQAREKPVCVAEWVVRYYR